MWASVSHHVSTCSSATIREHGALASAHSSIKEWVVSYTIRSPFLTAVIAGVTLTIVTAAAPAAAQTVDEAHKGAFGNG